MRVSKLQTYNLLLKIQKICAIIRPNLNLKYHRNLLYYSWRLVSVFLEQNKLFKCVIIQKHASIIQQAESIRKDIALAKIRDLKFNTWIRSTRISFSARIWFLIYNQSMDDCCVFQFSRQRASTLRREHFRPASLLLMHFIAASNGFASRYISSMHEYQRTAEKGGRNREKKREYAETGILHIALLFSRISSFHLAICGVRWLKSTIKP